MPLYKDLIYRCSDVLVPFTFFIFLLFKLFVVLNASYGNTFFSLPFLEWKSCIPSLLYHSKPSVVHMFSLGTR